jgi:hypothetical protein
MESRKKGLLAEETEQAFVEELTDSDPSNSSSDNTSGTDGLAVGNATVFKHSD